MLAGDKINVQQNVSIVVWLSDFIYLRYEFFRVIFTDQASKQSYIIYV